MIREIEQLIASGTLDQFDRYFAGTLQRLAPAAGPRTLVLAALARKAVANGHVCLDLERLVDGAPCPSPQNSLPPGGGGLGRGGNSDDVGSSPLHPPPASLPSAVTTAREGESMWQSFARGSGGVFSSEPSLAELIAELQGSPLVSRDGTLAPLVLEGPRLYLQRYWRYEEELAQEIRARAAHPVPVRDELLESCLSQLFIGTEQDGQQR
ncbi:MAG: hypothetical protein ACYC2W_04855, partial [Desulfurivibrionaceae bacterium]